jgi:hypothetical protein
MGFGTCKSGLNLELSRKYYYNQPTGVCPTMKTISISDELTQRAKTLDLVFKPEGDCIILVSSKSSDFGFTTTDNSADAFTVGCVFRSGRMVVEEIDLAVAYLKRTYPTITDAKERLEDLLAELQREVSVSRKSGSGT